MSEEVNIVFDVNLHSACIDKKNFRWFSRFFGGFPKAHWPDAQEVTFYHLGAPVSIYHLYPFYHLGALVSIFCEVCKRWERLTGDDTLWKRLDLGLAAVPQGCS